MGVAVGSVGFRAGASHGLWRPPGPLLPPPAPTFTQVGADNFNRANGTLAGSNNWLATSDGSATIIGNEASGVGASIAGDYRTETYTSDQYATATVGSVNNVTGSFVGLMLRHNSVSNADVVGLYFINAGQPTVAIYSRATAGAYTARMAVNVSTLAVGTVLTFYVIGSVFVLQVAGVSQVSITDPTFTGGSPGLTTFGTMTLDNWAGGNATMGTPLGATIASDNFNRVNGNVSAGQPNWTPITVSFSGTPCIDGVIVTNEVNVSDTDHHADYRNETFNPNHWSSIAVGTIAPVISSTPPFVGVLLRWNGTQGYLVCYFAGGGPPGNSYRIFLIQATLGSTLLASCATDGNSGSASPSNPTGTVYTGVVRGSRVSMRCNGTEVLAVNDTSCVAGQPGYQLFPQAAGTTADNFVAGNV